MKNTNSTQPIPAGQLFIASISGEKRTALRKISSGKKSDNKKVPLVYINDSTTGIRRVKKGKAFEYFLNNKKITDAATLGRIKSLVIPPAWTDVWICQDENGHLQATGRDAKNRKQYRYHPQWNHLRNHAKYSSLLEFGKSLPQIRKQIEKDIAQQGITESKVIALVVQLMQKTYIRVGNEYYERMNGSHGLTTLKDKHVKISGPEVSFIFTGKKGVAHNITLKNKKLAALIKQCRDIPGKELFQYLDENGTRKKIDSGMVNNYIKTITKKQFTAKDFRTWAGSVHALQRIASWLENQEEGGKQNKKTRLNDILDYVSGKLGNTRAVCKKYYIHPLILDHCEKKETLKPMGNMRSDKWMSCTEKWLMKLLNQGPAKLTKI